MKNKPGYEDSLKELNQILSELESGEISVDEIAKKVKRANELLDYCQSRLRSIENEMEKFFGDKDDED